MSEQDQSNTVIDPAGYNRPASSSGAGDPPRDPATGQDLPSTSGPDTVTAPPPGTATPPDRATDGMVAGPTGLTPSDPGAATQPPADEPTTEDRLNELEAWRDSVERRLGLVDS